jgi:FdhD protein
MSTMSEPSRQPDAVKLVPSQRVSTIRTDPRPAEETVAVVRETALTIDVDGLHTFTVLCTPQDREDLAVGFLYSEGVIENVAEIQEVRWIPDEPDKVRVQLSERVAAHGDPGRSLIISSSCGACGDENLESRISSLLGVGDHLTVEPELLRSVSEALFKQQVLFHACGGTHAAGSFDETGRLLSTAEDAGRHNALDKAIGKCLRAGVCTRGRGVALSGRVSLEMVSKCARAGIEVITAVSAPTSLAIEVADGWNITLCAFVREERATVFTHPQRLAGCGDLARTTDR